jgi:cytochrome c peroxidase
VPGRALLVLGALAAGCARRSDPEETGVVDTGESAIRALLGIPDHFQVPYVPEDNPVTEEGLTLGRHLFYDRRLSGNETQSCADCHHQELAFADGLVTPEGSTGDALVRNSPGLSNVAWLASLTWAHDSLLTLEDQLPVPITGELPVELGVNDGNQQDVLRRFDDDPEYAAMFAAAFPESDSGATLPKVEYALATFVRSMVSGGSPYDRWLAGDRDAMTEQQELGMTLFNGEVFECFHCHGGTHFTISYRDAGTTEGSVQYAFFNTGLYNVDGDGGYPAYDQGLYEVTFDPEHRGFFRPPGLRNVALTAPYMHDGSIATLPEVVEHYAAGGRNVAEGPNAGDGRVNPLKSGLVRPFSATEEEKAAVVAFLEALTDPGFVTNPALSNPFE